MPAEHKTKNSFIMRDGRYIGSIFAMFIAFIEKLS